MSRRVSACSVLLLSAACLSLPRSPTCGWSNEPSAVLNLKAPADQRHLNADARTAEELAIRYADVTRGHRSGHYTGPDEYRRTRDDCFARLVRQVADRHGLLPSQVADAVTNRDGRLDAMVLIVFAMLFGLACNALARALFDRFPRDEPAPALIGALAAAVGLSAAGVIIGGLAASVVEMIQLGDLHMSYRASRLPWQQHWRLLFAGCIALFSIIATLRWRRVSPGGE